jgi:type I restriction enzyme S subunit
LPEGWHPKQLREIATVRGGGGLGLTKSDYVDAGTPAYSAAGQDGYVDVVEGVEPSIVLSAIGARCGKSFLTDGPWATLANTQVITPDPRLADASYLIGLLDNEGYWNRSGSAQPFIKPSDVKGAWVPVPPLDEQLRISEVLRSVREAVDATRAELAALRGVASALIQDHCGSVHADSRLRIGDFANFVGSGVTPRGGKDAYVSKGVAFIRSQNVHFDGLRAEGLAFIDRATDAKMSRTRVRPDDVLLNITGASIGRCTTVPSGFGPANVNQHVCIIRSNTDVVLPSYLSLFLSSHDGQRQIDQLQGGLSREGLNFQQVRAISVPAPPLEVQLEVSETISSLHAATRALELERARKEAMRAGLLNDLLSGRVRVPA